MEKIPSRDFSENGKVLIFGYYERVIFDSKRASGKLNDRSATLNIAERSSSYCYGRNLG